jgi:hypothetical protein
MKLINLLTLLLLVGFAFSCSDLEEEIRDTVPADIATSGAVSVDALLQGVYNDMRLPYQDQSRFWAAQEHTSDEVLGPTRGPDWDDNGIWRVLHDHTWDADHDFLNSTFTELLQIVYNASVIVNNFQPTAEQAAEARFLRAFAMFSVLDGWGQVPFRDNLDDFTIDPVVYTGDEAIAFIESEINAIMDDLPDGPTNRANKDAAKVFLMKLALNKGVFADRENPSFDNGDMDKVISLADEIMGSGKYTLADNVFDNFAPNNDEISTENIYTWENVAGENNGGGNSVRSRWFCTLHYNQNPSGWNGFTTISDFYNKFEDGDARKTGDYPGQTDVSGIKVGFLVGQQFDQDGNPLQDRKENPLAFTEEVSLVETGDNLEVTGIRVIKYPIDFDNGDNVDNDYVFYRLADVMLMKAEALLRKGDAGSALDIVNEIRTKRGAGALSSLDEQALLDERGRELYWEGHRRQDLIRFGKFLDSWNEKPASGPERLLFPIPNQALATNPNLKQNPGY